MSRTVILHNRDYRGMGAVPVIGRSGKKYGAAFLVDGTRTVEYRMPFEEWEKNCWDIAQGGRRAGFTFYVADIIEDGATPATEPEPLIFEPKAETAKVQPDPLADLPEPSEPALPPSGEPCGSKEARQAQLEGLSFRALRSIAKSSGIDVTDLNKSPQLVEAIISIEFP